MKRLIFVIGVFIVALALSAFHWVGIIIGGLIVGYFSKNLKEAVAAGLALSLFIFGAFLAYLAYMGMLEKFLTLSPLPYISLLLCMALAVISATITNFFSPFAVKQS
ncbi:hypothetical protein [Archaeoglobus sp.]|uniref:hypothetical protein n=1 Tax=Archaeoglobus sp. TaxID=1872626 RepID=UPI0024AAB439|nr:hypothetical protein [Archaeoglobus sp.]MDI3498764.1 hypothetical protein [Archaeoglobus sp.]